MIKTTPEKWIGQTRMMRCGMKATVIAYRNFNDIDVQFENGTIREHKSTGNFNQGRISPNSLKNNYSEKWIGQTRTMNCGLKTTIIAYRNNNDIDIQFENGIIREHVRLYNFKKDSITPIFHGAKTHYVGQTRIMNCGLKATIIACRKFNDIDVQFENNIIRKHITIQNFYNDSIAKTPRPTENDYIGQTHTMNCGLKATIISYKNSHDIDIQFEDGTVRKHSELKHFKNGNVAHPTNVLFDAYKLNKAAFVFHDKTYFYVTYTENDSEILDVMCVDDMKQKLPLLTNPNNPEI